MEPFAICEKLCYEHSMVSRRWVVWDTRNDMNLAVFTYKVDAFLFVTAIYGPPLDLLEWEDKIEDLPTPDSAPQV